MKPEKIAKTTKKANAPLSAECNVRFSQTKKSYFCEEFDASFSEQEKIEIENYPLKLLRLSKYYEIIDGVVLDKRVERLKEIIGQFRGWQKSVLWIALKLYSFVSISWYLKIVLRWANCLYSFRPQIS